MPMKGGRKQQEKRLRFQIETALIPNHDPFPYFQKLAQFLEQKNPQDTLREYLFLETVGNQPRVS